VAAQNGKYEGREILLPRAKPPQHQRINTLSLALSNGYVNIIKLLLPHGAEINSRTGSNLAADTGRMNGHTQAVKLLIGVGSDVNSHIETNRNTALTLACFHAAPT
jgi:ankyrin repeat domain-containing protein 17